MWVNQPTAILVIHGMGEQNPLETLDSCARTLLPVLEAEAQKDGHTLVKSHRLVARGTWNENYISVTLRERQAPPIDIYEYYWAHETEREITGGEVLAWLVQVGMLARKYYDENQTLADHYEKEGDSAFGKRFIGFGSAKFKKHWYLKYCGLVMTLMFATLALTDPILGYFVPQFIRPLKVVTSLLSRFPGNKIAASFGDVVLYTTTDQKSSYYSVRQRILGGAVDKVRQLLIQISPVEYGHIILVGHSLGSVIAYDTLNRINHDLNVGAIKLVRANGKEASVAELAGKLKGLVTFGSPLDKIAFFFRSRAGEKEYIREQIQANFHSFRAKHWKPGYQPPAPLALENDIRAYLDDMVWLNFWDPKDPVGGALDFYLVDYRLDPSGKKVDVLLPDGKRGTPAFEGNIKISMNCKTAWESHTAYWDSIEMYERVVRQVIL